MTTKWRGSLLVLRREGGQRRVDRFVAQRMQAMKTTIWVLLVLTTALASCSGSQAGRFVPQGGTIWAVDTKTGQRCRLQGETLAEEDAWIRKQNQRVDEQNQLIDEINKKGVAPMSHLARLQPATPLCSELIAAEEHRTQVITMFILMTLIALGGLYLIIRRWHRWYKEAPIV